MYLLYRIQKGSPTQQHTVVLTPLNTAAPLVLVPQMSLLSLRLDDIHF